MAEVKIIRPQEGYQMRMMSSPADIVIGGAAAGVGKTYSLLLEPLRHKDVPGFGSVIFRRTSPQIRNEGGLWDTSMEIYPHVGAEPKESYLEWIFPKGPKLKFSHLEYEKNVFDWQGSQIPFIGFDELPHFSKKMFFYMLSRNRSVCGVRPYVRATCNPDPDSWLSELLSWWIDQDTGDPIPERDGVIRYFVREGDNYIWGDSIDEVKEKAWYFLETLIERSKLEVKDFIKSITFISGSIYDNKELLKVDPAYLGNLLTQDKETQSILLRGNWKMVVSDRDIYDYPSFLGMFNNVYDLEDANGRYITADIALKGSNKFVAGCWYGKSLEDILIMDKSNGKEVITGIENMAKVHKVQNHHICYDNDGVGGFVDGYITGAIPFVNNGTPFPNPEATTQEDKCKPENYEHLKAQCYYRSGDAVKAGKYKISESVANTMYDENLTVRQRFMQERKAIKRGKPDSDGKLKIIKKEEMKALLNGDSPDLMDMFSQRERFDLEKEFAWSF